MDPAGRNFPQSLHLKLWFILEYPISFLSNLVRFVKVFLWSKIPPSIVKKSPQLKNDRLDLEVSHLMFVPVENRLILSPPVHF